MTSSVRVVTCDDTHTRRKRGRRQRASEPPDPHPAAHCLQAAHPLAPGEPQVNLDLAALCTK